MQESGLTEIIPLTYSSAIWGQYPHFLMLSAPTGGDCSSWLLYGRHPVSILKSLRAHLQGSCNVMAWQLQHPLLLIWEATFFSLIKSILLFFLILIYSFIWLYRVLVVVRRIFDLLRHARSFCCIMQDLVPWPGFEPWKSPSLLFTGWSPHPQTQWPQKVFVRIRSSSTVAP